MVAINIAILNENGIEGRRGTAPVFGSEKFLFENQVGLLYYRTGTASVVIVISIQNATFLGICNRSIA